MNFKKNLLVKAWLTTTRIQTSLLWMRLDDEISKRIYEKMKSASQQQLQQLHLTSLKKNEDEGRKQKRRSFFIGVKR
jgi:hypothetical protein